MATKMVSLRFGLQVCFEWSVQRPLRGSCRRVPSIAGIPTACTTCYCAARHTHPGLRSCSSVCSPSLWRRSTRKRPLRRGKLYLRLRCLRLSPLDVAPTAAPRFDVLRRWHGRWPCMLCRTVGALAGASDAGTSWSYVNRFAEQLSRGCADAGSRRGQRR
jgi:hypothetical protein